MVTRAGRVGVLVRVVVLVAAIACGAGAGWWASRATLVQPVPDADADVPSFVEVVPGSVGRSVTLAVTVEQPMRVAATNVRAGMVTARSDGGSYAVGDEVFAIDDVPVRVVEGEMPFYRDLEVGCRGADVQQLQNALVVLGYQSRSDGVFDEGTRSAVRAWQRATGASDTGVVAFGTLLAVPTVSTSLAVGDEIRVGLRMAGGEDAVSVPYGEREFRLVLSDSQAREIPADASVRIAFGEYRWDARTAGSEINDEGAVVMTLVGADGGQACGAECDAIPLGERVSLRADVVVEDEVHGSTVPATVVRTSESGDTYVVMEDGTRRDVTVIGSGRGLVVLEGVTTGETVLLGSPRAETGQQG